MTLTTAQLEQFAMQLAASPHRWQHLVPYDDARAYAQVWDADDVNAWVIRWSEGHDTGFHDHDESAAAILVLEGQIREERLRLSAPPDTRTMKTGHMFVVPPTAIHRVRHAGSVPAITIHVYSPPLRRTGAYRVGPDGGLERVSQPYERELRAELTLS
jgi:mannose-6-phosphate isomerase-like protein (cupin superfamily)